MRHRTTAFAAALCLLALGTVACSSDDPAKKAAQRYAAQLPTGHFDGVEFVDNTGSAVAAASVSSSLAAMVGDVPLAGLKATIGGDVPVTKDNAHTTMTVDWTIAGAVWHYTTDLRLVKRDSAWKVVWEPTGVVPGLTNDDNTLALHTTRPTRGLILDGADQPLVKPRPVIDVGINPAGVKNMSALVSALQRAFAKIHLDISLDDLPARVDAAKANNQFVLVVTLRREIYDQIRPDIHDLDGTQFIERDQILAPTKEFARALLGTVGEVQADQIKADPEHYIAGDIVGHGGLQEQFDHVLGGTKGVEVATGKGKVLFTHAATAGGPLSTTLDPRIQAAADAALAGTGQRSALVAIRISDGALVAVANGPGGGDLNLAFTASVPPGSTFKMVSALSLLDSGAVTPDTTVECPKTYSVEGRTFKNAGDFALGLVPFHTDFAKSCNTAFASLADKLGPDGLSKAAATVGLGTAWTVGVDATTGSVPVNAPAVEQAAAAFGQGQTLVSPLAMAAATASVARGSWLTPKLFRTQPDGAKRAPADKPAPPTAGAALKPASVAALKSMMREVVIAGTATALVDVPKGDVYAKTGTAEFDNDPSHTHAWTVGWQGDIAFAVFVENGGSSATTAVPIVESFLRAL
jgi:cell division protein FtsI/penicillin-binding protein 2